MPHAPAHVEESGGGGAAASVLFGLLSVPAALMPFLGLPVGFLGLAMGLYPRQGAAKRTASIGTGLSVVGLVLSSAIGIIQNPIIPDGTQPRYTASSVNIDWSGSSLVTGTGYTFQAPSGWNVTTTSLTSASTVENVIRADNDDASAPVMTINVEEDAESNVGNANFKQDQVSTQLPGFKWASWKRLNLAGSDSIRSSWTYDDDGGKGKAKVKMWNLRVVTLRNRKEYTFSCSALASKQEKYEPIFDAMLNSLSWTG